MYEDDNDRHVPYHIAREFLIVGDDDLDPNDDVNQAIKKVGSAVRDIEEALEILSESEWQDADEVDDLIEMINDGKEVYRQIDGRYLNGE